MLNGTESGIASCVGCSIIITAKNRSPKVCLCRSCYDKEINKDDFKKNHHKDRKDEMFRKAKELNHDALLDRMLNFLIDKGFEI